jgi:hypothetical protein
MGIKTKQNFMLNLKPMGKTQKIPDSKVTDQMRVKSDKFVHFYDCSAKVFSKLPVLILGEFLQVF